MARSDLRTTERPENSSRKRKYRAGDDRRSTSGIGLSVSLLVVITMLTLVGLAATPAVSGQSLWLVSRAAAVTAYLVLTVITVLGLVLSHPRNKDTWRLHRYLLGWHQALVGVLFPLIAVHLTFTVLDGKSGVTLAQLPFPIHAKYYPAAMTAGAIALYVLLFITASAMARKKFRRWLAVHRLSLVTWVLLWVHGVFGGTDATQLKWVYIVTGTTIFLVSMWRYWVNRYRRPIERRHQNAS